MKKLLTILFLGICLTAYGYEHRVYSDTMSGITIKRSVEHRNNGYTLKETIYYKGEVLVDKSIDESFGYSNLIEPFLRGEDFLSIIDHTSFEYILVNKFKGDIERFIKRSIKDNSRYRNKLKSVNSYNVTKEQVNNIIECVVEYIIKIYGDNYLSGYNFDFDPNNKTSSLLRPSDFGYREVGDIIPYLALKCLNEKYYSLDK